MRTDAWVIGISAVGIVAVVGLYVCLRHAIPEASSDPMWAVYGVVGVLPYAFAAYGCGAAPLTTIARRVAIASGLVVCLAGLSWLWLAADEAVEIRRIRESGREHGVPGSAFLVLLILPIQFGAGLVAAFAGGIARDLKARRTPG